MALEKGQRLGPYEIESPTGAGGMGEVYRARDTRLDRTVAIKVLPDRTAMNSELRARFEREAKAISSLNHPNICTLHDVGHQEGIDFLVMEYLEGESLEQRLKRGELDIKEVLDISSQIADALDYAHFRGLIHRDLKPSNIYLTPEGAKLLDFGLAKIREADGVIEGADENTRTTPLTGKGSIIGTLNYMSPEQLEGKEADNRSDIFAFGAVLYEMLTGQRAFSGQSQASLIAGIIEREPVPPSEIKPMTPPGLNRLVRKCLAKDPEQRWQSTRDLADELRWISQSGSQAGIPSPVSIRRKFRLRLAWMITLAAIAATVVFAALWFSQTEPEPRIRRFSIEFGDKFRNISWPRISPDGQFLAFKATDTTGESKIWIRPLNSLEAYPLAGTEDALRPFWSPDSRYLAYITDNNDQLKKISISGGLTQLVGEVPNGADGSWGSRGIILLDGGRADSIRQISASGGLPTAATKLDRDTRETGHAWPEFLPDGRHFLYRTQIEIDSSTTKDVVKIGSIDSDDSKILFEADTRFEYCAQGYILYIRDGVLLAQPFNHNSLELTGEPVPITDRIMIQSGERANFSISDEGTLVYEPESAALESELIWMDREGREIEKIGKPALYGGICLSPDGEKVAYTLRNDEHRTYDIWIKDLKRNVASRLTFDTKDEHLPRWSPDGDYIYYNNLDLPINLIMKRLANGTGDAITLFDEEVNDRYLFDISPDGRKLVCVIFGGTNFDLEIHSLEGNEEPIIIGAKSFNKVDGSFSPDGRFLSYVTDESGKFEVYVCQIDGGGGKWQISYGGGALPIWSRDGKEIFYHTEQPDGFFMVVPVNTQNGFEAGLPDTLFSRRLGGVDLDSWRYAVAPDGQRLLVNAATEDLEREPGFIIVQDWHKEIKSR